MDVISVICSIWRDVISMIWIAPSESRMQTFRQENTNYKHIQNKGQILSGRKKGFQGFRLAKS